MNSTLIIGIIIGIVVGFVILLIFLILLPAIIYFLAPDTDLDKAQGSGKGYPINDFDERLEK